MLRDLASLAGGRTVGSLVLFIGYAHLARVLDPTLYGFIELAVWVALLGAMVVDAGLGTIGTRELSQRREIASELADKIPACQFLVLLGVLPITFLLPFAMRQPWNGTLMIWMCCLALFGMPWKLDWLFQGLEMMKIAGFFYAFRATIFTVGVVLFVDNNADFLTVGWIELLSAAALVGYFLYFQIRYVGPVRLRFSKEFLRTYIPQGLHVGLSNIIWTVIQSIPMVLLAAFHGKEQTAWFAAPLRIVVSVLTLSWIYHYNLYPTFARQFYRSPEALREVLSASLRTTTWGACFAALLMAVLANPLLSLIFGSRFEESAPTFGMLIWIFPITLVSGHFRLALTVSGKQRHVFDAHIAGLITVIGVGLIFIPLFSSEGAAATILAAGLAVLVSAYLFCLKRMPSPASLQIVVPPVVLALGLLAVLSGFPCGPWLSSGIAVAAFLVFGLCDQRILRDMRLLSKAKA